MRKKNHEQMPLMDIEIEHPRAEELMNISRILDTLPTINEMVLQDLRGGEASPRPTGAQGMSAEQVLRAAIIKQLEGFSYEEPAFHLVDSRTYRSFCRIGVMQKGFKKSTLCSNIKKISAQTWEQINQVLVGYAKDKKIEKGRESRIDCTVVETNIHEPSDRSLLWDCVRVITDKLVQIRDELAEVKVPFSDHRKRAKRRMMGILNAKNEKIRKRRYIDLLKVTEKTLCYGRNAICLLKSAVFVDTVKMVKAQGIKQELERVIPLTQRVMDQTRRRVILGEKVPATEKIVSIFEPHTDIIIKDRREVLYGHKVCLSGGASNLITDCLIVEGNPADSTLTTEMLDRHEAIYGRYPLKVALDGGFASKDNLREAKSRGVKDVCFGKKRGLKEEQMCRSSWV